MASWAAKAKEVVAFGGGRSYEKRRRQWNLVAGRATRKDADFPVMSGECEAKIGTVSVPVQPKTAKHHPAIVHVFAVIH